MTYTAKVSVCSQIRTKHSTQNEQHVRIFELQARWYVKKTKVSTCWSPVPVSKCH